MKFNETKSQERLINLMLQAGVEWPEGAKFAVQHKCNLCVAFSADEDFVRDSGKSHWTHSNSEFFGSQELTSLCPNWHTTIITREQWEARDGWITWHGGECPVDGCMEVETILRKDEAFDLTAVPAHVLYWDHSLCGEDIIAYRIHKEQSVSEPCEPAKACITNQPTIEQLIAEWKRKDEAVGQEERNLEAQQSALDAAKRDADEAKKSVDDALLAAGYFIGGSVVEAEQPTITDWRDLRVGDVVWWSGDSNFSDGEYVVDDLDFDDESMPFYLADGDWVRHEKEKWKFIRRP